MANTFSQIYLQFVFAVKGRQNLIHPKNKEELHKYVTALVQARNAKMLAVHCMPDHIHLFVGFKPSILISDFVKQIKVQSNEFIRNKKWIQGSFNWQEGYGVFSYGHSQIDRVCKYVQNQELHHQKKTFQEEYLDFLQKFSIPFEERFLFEWP
ncbi:IS200/IS605 family transposase [Niabella hibiscisoli]|uniref:IS200/IS605 family transposase n=1 Tax=Niabella hibiscisoli TaxID=1825928 RepID=UPI001F0E991C|nr:IS200/IS605 family transposase [Niabella hibiscisoli]MCH5718068.1 IS200/IS605 family transposase [Niabella hibiscisoli]